MVAKIFIHFKPFIYFIQNVIYFIFPNPLILSYSYFYWNCIDDYLYSIINHNWDIPRPFS